MNNKVLSKHLQEFKYLKRQNYEFLKVGLLHRSADQQNTLRLQTSYSGSENGPKLQ